MLGAWRAFLAAVSTLTIVPAGRGTSWDDADLRRAVAFFPLVGLLLGMGLAAVAEVLSFAPALLRAALLVTFLTAATGGLHLDGLADLCDGLAGSHPGERLSIMADPRVGIYGLLGVVCLLLLKFAALASLDLARARAALMAAPAIGRWAMTLVLTSFPYPPHHTGLGSAFKAHGGSARLLAGTAVVAALALVLPAVYVLAVLTLSAALSWAMGRYAVAKLGGATGDVYGAVCEMAETLTLVVTALAGTGGVR